MAMFARRRFSIGGAKSWHSPDNPLHSFASVQPAGAVRIFRRYCRIVERNSLRWCAPLESCRNLPVLDHIALEDKILEAYIRAAPRIAALHLSPSHTNLSPSHTNRGKQCFLRIVLLWPYVTPARSPALVLTHERRNCQHRSAIWLSMIQLMSGLLLTPSFVLRSLMWWQEKSPV